MGAKFLLCDNKGHRKPAVPEALRKVLVKFATCTVSTHSLDSDFSIAQRRTSPQSAHQGAQSECDQVQLILDKGSIESLGDQAVSLAQRLWVRWYGHALILRRS